MTLVCVLTPARGLAPVCVSCEVSVDESLTDARRPSCGKAAIHSALAGHMLLTARRDACRPTDTDEAMASDFADDESRAAGPRDARSAEMRRSIDAINAVRAGRIGNPAMVDAAMMAEAALKMGAGPRSAEFARVRSRQGYDRLARMLSNVFCGFCCVRAL